MSTFSLNTIDINSLFVKPDGTYQAKSHPKEVGWLNRYQAKGAFADLDTIKDINKVRNLIETCHKSKEDKSRSINLGRVRAFLKLAGSNTGLDKTEHQDLLKRYDVVINSLLEKSRTDRAEGICKEEDLFDFEPVHQQAWQNYENKKIIYDMELPSDEDIENLQDSIIALTQVSLPHTRSNMATLKNVFHDDANLKKDNVFIPAEKGYSVLVWNERKVDRITMGKLSKEHAEPDYDKQRFVQPLVEKTPIPLMEPEKIGAIMTRFVKRFRKDSLYVFTKTDGTPFVREDKDTHRFDPYLDRVKKVVGHSISKIRKSQITHVRSKNLSQKAQLEYATDCHHSREENNKYCRDNLAST